MNKVAVDVILAVCIGVVAYFLGANVSSTERHKLYRNGLDAGDNLGRIIGTQDGYNTAAEEFPNHYKRGYDDGRESALPKRIGNHFVRADGTFTPKKRKVADEPSV